MQLPDAVYGLEYGLGTIYGLEEEAAALEALRNGAPGNGPKVLEFEAAFAAYVGVEHALAVSSGTAALELAMTALGVGPGDEVITTPLSWIATANGAASRGAAVVFADVDARRFTLDPSSVAASITPRTKAIVPVHLYGQCADMDPILTVARQHGIPVVEDCAHAPGAEYKGRRAGSMADMAIFSFGYQKNMGTLGEGGMLVTRHADLAEKVRSHRWLCCHGYDPRGRYCQIDATAKPMEGRYWWLEFDEVGRNLRMTDVQAAVGRVQLGKLEGLNERRRQLACRLSSKLAGIKGLTLPYVAPESKHVFHVYCVLVEPEFGLSKEELMWTLATRQGIKPWSHYMPIHLTQAYRKLGHREGECPVAEELFRKSVSLPLHPRLSDDAVDYMAECLWRLAGASTAPAPAS